MIITTNNYHNIEVLLKYDDDGHLVSSELHRIYYRYGFFKGSGQVKTGVGYIAINFLNSGEGASSKQIVALYDSRDYENDDEKGYSQRYMLGGVRYFKSDQLLFSFNTTYDERSNGSRTGLIVNNPFSEEMANMWEFTISRNLTLDIKKKYKRQELKFLPFSDFQESWFSLELI